MLHQPFSRTLRAGTIETPRRTRTDRSMDVLQYGMAVLAIAGAVLLASFR